MKTTSTSTSRDPCTECCICPVRTDLCTIDGVHDYPVVWASVMHSRHTYTDAHRGTTHEHRQTQGDTHQHSEMSHRYAHKPHA
eukprot:3547-Eustigmatos_ZCMA.PRE.1